MYKCNGALTICLHDCDAVSVAFEISRKRGGLDIRPAVTVEAGAEEATCGEAGISFALFENVRAVVCHWRISAMHRDEMSVSNRSGSAKAFLYQPPKC